MPANDKDFEARKAREDAFFEACEATGNYVIYDEYEFEKPLVGLTEEPVVTEYTVEESTKISENTDLRKNMKITIK